MNKFAQLDHAHVWHPFTQMRDWLKQEPRVIASGRGTVLRDTQGRKYLDANSSIWTNLHGHNHPRINAALGRQLRRLAHSSALGLANEPAALLAQQLVTLANPPGPTLKPGARAGKASPVGLQKVFFSDDGSTAMEVALKLAYEFTRRTRGPKSRPRFLSLDGAYHGDTVGAVSLGHIDLFHQAYAGLLFKSDRVMAPYCYRCPFNRAQPQRADARDYRRCHWECVGLVEKKFNQQKRQGNAYAALVFEPLIQGSAGMIPQPKGWLRQVTDIARHHGALLIADEVMTGFARCGLTPQALPQKGPEGLHQRSRPSGRGPSPVFACHQEHVQPDFLALAKGLTGGYLPMAATLTTQQVFGAFLGKYAEFKSFFHGHSFSGNQLGASAALASLEVLGSEKSVQHRAQLQQRLGQELSQLWASPLVGDIRQVGLIAGVELVKDWRTREPFALQERAGIRVCEAMARHGVLTRPVGNVVVLMPPYCTTFKQVRQMVEALAEGVRALGTPRRLRKR